VKQRIQRKKSFFLCGIVLFLSTVAYQAYTQDIKAYIYDEEGYAVPCPRPYIYEAFIDFTFLPSGALYKPEDLFIDKEGNFYIADTGNKRILKLSSGGKILLEIKNKEMPKPMGLFVDDERGDIYIADSGKNHLLRFDSRGELLRIYPKPESAVIPEDFIYSPAKVLIDKRGLIYVIGTGASKGIILLDKEGAFRGFFGANPAPFSFSRWLARLVATEEQKVKLLLQTLLTSSNFTIDDQGFIYVVTKAIEEDQIRKLNALGINTYEPGEYGEEHVVSKRNIKPPELSSIDVNKEGIITVLDGMTSKIFQYNQAGDLLFTFGGKSDSVGFFREAKDIALDGNTGLFYVLDSKQKGLHVFKPTAFAESVYEASFLYNNGEYERALDIWQDILSLDSNYPLAHKGVAKALSKLGRKFEDMEFLKAAMVHYEYAGDREGYSEAFELHRYRFLRKNLGLIIVVAIAAIACAWLFVRFFLPFIKKRAAVPLLSNIKSVFAILNHPFRTLESIKYNFSRKYTLLSLGVLFFYLIAHLISLYGTSYHFADWDPNQINLATELSRLFLPWLTWCISNYLITLIFNGEGTFGQIFTFSAYSLLPYIIITLVLTLLSHVLSLNEMGIYTALKIFMYVWMVILFLSGVCRVHDYTLRGAVGISALSIIGVVLVWGAAILIFGLVSSFADFFIDLGREIGFHV
jgi:tetratricopeptide (TPR) repeat protein